MVYIDVVVSTIDCITVYLLLFQRLCKLPKRCTRLPAASDNVYQLLAHGRWFSPASSTAKTGRHDIAELFTGTCFIQKIYAPSSSLLQGKHLPFSPSPLRLNISYGFFICIRNSLDRPCVTMPHDHLLSNVK